MGSETLLIVLVIAFLFRGVTVLIIKQRNFKKLEEKIAFHKQIYASEKNDLAKYATTKSGRALLHLLSARYHDPTTKELEKLLEGHQSAPQITHFSRPTFNRPIDIQLEGIEMAEALSGFLDESLDQKELKKEQSPLFFIEAITLIKSKGSLHSPNSKIVIAGLNSIILSDTFAEIDKAVVNTDLERTIAYLKILASTLNNKNNLKEPVIFNQLIEKTNYLLHDIGVNYDSSRFPNLNDTLLNLTTLLAVFSEEVQKLEPNTKAPLRIRSMGILCGDEINQLVEGLIAAKPHIRTDKFKPV